MTPDKVPQNFYLGGGLPESVMSLNAAVLLLLACVCILGLARKHTIIPVLLASLLVPRGEVLVLGGFHFNPVRIIVLVGWIRLAYLRISTGNEIFGKRWNSVDNALLWSSLFLSISFVLLWLQWAAVFNQIGILWSSIGMFFLLRALLRNEEDVHTAVNVLIVVAAVNALGMIREQVSNQNLFGVLLGGVDVVPSLRDGKIRSQGVFAHAILAGTYGATLLPLCLLLWHKHGSKIMAITGVLACAVMVYTSASSTPTIAVVFGVLGLCLWPIRSKMRIVRWGIVAFLVIAQLFMKAPVWFLIAHMDVVGASSGYHRAELVDVFIRHFFDWFLIGTKDASTWGWEMFDVSNQYVSKGEAGGLLALVFFILVISRSFGNLGRTRRSVIGSRKEWALWTLGAALLAHVMAFFGISYWDQTEVAWFAVIAMISAATAISIPKPIRQTDSAHLEKLTHAESCSV